MSTEIWGMHPETGLYVSSHGRIITERKGVHYGCPTVNGYQVVRYAGKCRYMHRLVAETFIPNPEDKPQVNHINGIKDDNRAENLEWCTRGENIKHAYKTGLNTPNPTKGEAHINSKLTEDQAREIKQNAQGLTQEVLGAKYGVSQTTISKIQRGEKWTHVK